ncbi:PAS domain-containing protein [Rhodovulum steppense]|uniref:Aerotaxis receptor n=1 Tax=Rhodovulum steppense TaxID=540251 RepID=A0A4R1YGY0_9RHOB|nr:PAS domain-containing protein [Rhodovulum steppense]TCM75466.1 aerotaxis receptor [Rhodovulum steppense]
MDQTAGREAIADLGEVEFGIDEIFYSRTDDRGVIRAGNSVFQRISGHDWPALIGAPHKIIRHPDMPRAVFWLLWQTIQGGSPVAAYVKNRSRDGRHYWVFAVVLPVEGGFLSVRIKPSDPLFAAVRAEYETLRARERYEKLSPEASATILLSRLKELGFANYGDFMAQSLGRELAMRDAASGEERCDRLDDLEAIREGLIAAAQEQHELIRTFGALKSVPTNIRILANRLEPVGGPITAISENYKTASTEIVARLGAFAGQDDNLCDRMARVVSEAVFLIGCTEVQSELVRQFRAEAGSPGHGDPLAEMATLTALEAQCKERARAGLVEAMRVARSLSQASLDLRRMVLGLDSIRVMGRVECGRLSAGGESLAGMIEQLETYHNTLKDRLEAIVRLSDRIHGGAERYGTKAA